MIDKMREFLHGLNFAAKVLKQNRTKEYFKQRLSLAVAFVLLINSIVVYNLVSTVPETLANDPVVPTVVDGSTGRPSYDWLSDTDTRYDSTNLAALGSLGKPYIIKNGDEMRALAIIVNDGSVTYGNARGFLGQYITVGPNGQGGDNGQVIDLIAHSGVFGVDENGDDEFFLGGASTNIAPKKGWTAIGNSSYPFQGTFDGRCDEGFVIKNLGADRAVNTPELDVDGNLVTTVDLLNNSYIGLFGKVDFTQTPAGTLKNIRIENVQLKGVWTAPEPPAVAALTAPMMGMLAFLRDSLMPITAYAEEGETADKSESAPAEPKTEDSVFTPKTDEKSLDKAVDSEDKAVSDESPKDEAAVEKEPQGSDEKVDEKTETTPEKKPSLKDILDEAVEKEEKKARLSGSGSSIPEVKLFADVVVVLQLGVLAADVSAINDTYVAIDNCHIVGNTGADFAPFTIKIDGAYNASKYNHSIGGLVGSARGGKYINCTITNAVVNSGCVIPDVSITRNTGGFIGTGFDKIYVENCTFTGASGKIINRSSRTGGIVGTSYSATATTIKNCHFSASEIDTSGRVVTGGIISRVGNGGVNSISDCTVSGLIKATGSVGGILGDMFNTSKNTTVERCIFSGTITDNSIGSMSSGTAITKSAGGIVGNSVTNNTLTVKNCLFNGTITYPYASGDDVYLGGILGYSSTKAYIEDCVSTGDVLLAPLPANGTSGGKKDFMGGIAGYFTNGNIKKCAASSKIVNGMKNVSPARTDSAMGGIVGSVNAAGDYSIENNFSTSDITSSNVPVVGGIIGRAASASAKKLTVQNNYFTGSIYSENIMPSIAKSYAAGILARDERGAGSGFKQNYSAGGIFIEAAGGMIGASTSGRAYSSDKNCYDNDVTPHAPCVYASSGSTSMLLRKSTSEMISSTLSTDIGTAYDCSDATGYPELTWAKSPAASTDATITKINTIVKNLSYLSTRVWVDKGTADHNYAVTAPSYPITSLTLPDSQSVNITKTSASVLHGANSTELTHSFATTFTVDNVTYNFTARRRTVEKPSFTSTTENGRDDAYLIANADDFVEMTDYVRSGGGYFGSKYEITAPISLLGKTLTPMSGTSEGCTFSGDFNGTNEILSGISLTYSAKEDSIFGVTYAANMHDIAVSSPTITVTGYPGNSAIISGDTYESTFSNIEVRAPQMTITSKYFGAVVGAAHAAALTNVNVFEATARYATSAGGGLIMGYAGSTSVTDCHATGTITRQNGTVGGNTGQSDSSIFTRSSFVGKILAASNTGALLGNAKKDTQLVNCFAMGEVEGTYTQSNGVKTYTGTNIGGLIGNANEERVALTGSFFVGSVYGGDNTGGLVGTATSTGTGSNITNRISIESCYAKANVVGSGYYGGLIGATAEDSQIYNSYFVGQSGAGGAISGKTADIQNSFYVKTLLGPQQLEYPGSTNTTNGIFASQLMATDLSLGGCFNAVNAQNSYPQLAAFTGSSNNYFKAASAFSAMPTYAGDDMNNNEKTDTFTVTQYDSPIGWSAAVTATDPTDYGYFMDLTYDIPQESINQVNVYDNQGSIIGTGYHDTISDIFGMTTDPATPYITTYTAAAEKGKAIFNTAYNVPTLDGKDCTFTIPYTFEISIFEFGNGTDDEPYQIPDVETLRKFRDLINAGNGKPGTAYILTAPAGEVYDLSADVNWVPIGTDTNPFTGVFVGNGKEITNLTYTAKNKGVGLFGYANGGATIDNFSVTNFDAQFTVSNSFNAGIVIQRIAGATLSHVYAQGSFDVECTSAEGKDVYIGGAVGKAEDYLALPTLIDSIQTDVTADYTCTNEISVTGGKGAKVGGIAGAVMTADRTYSTITVSNSTAIVDFTTPEQYSGRYSHAGGLCGYIYNTSTNDETDRIFIRVNNAYGNIRGYYGMGGIVGRFTSNIADNYGSSRTTLVQNCLSAVDIWTRGDDVYGGGMIGEETCYNQRSKENNNTASQYYMIGGEFKNCVYAGLNEAGKGLSGKVGFTGTNATVLSRYETLFQDCLYNGNLCESAYDETYVSDTDSTTARKSAYYLSRAANAASMFTNSDAWTSATGYYPYTNNSVLSTVAPANYDNKVRLYSAAVHAARAAGGYSSFTTLCADARFECESPLELTVSENRVTAVESAVAQTTASLYLTGDDTTVKKINFTPSIEACGYRDFSYLANTPARDAIIAVDSWSLYNSDQVEGIGVAVNDAGAHTSVFDDNYFEYQTPEAEDFASELFTLGAHIDMSHCVAANGRLFIPIGVAANPFAGMFDGNYYQARNVHYDNTVANIGLFAFVAGSGSGVKNLGIISGSIDLMQIEETPENTDPSEPQTPVEPQEVPIAQAVGSIAANIANGAVIEDCYSCISVKAKAVAAGGLVGKSDGSSRATILHCFFTGNVLNDNVASQATGGIIGNGARVTVNNSYAAGFVANDTSIGAIVGDTSANTLITLSNYDLNACGYVNATGDGLGGQPTGIIQTSMVAAADDTPGAFSGTAWDYYEGLYPLQSGFGTDDYIAVMPVYFKAHSKSVTEGELLYPTATLTACAENAAGDYYLLASDRRSFVKHNSAFTTVELNYGEQSRELYMELKCWYDEAQNNVYTITTAAELAEFAAIVNGTVNTYNPNGTHIHQGIPDNFSGKTVTLGRDIDLSEIANWTPIGAGSNAFSGTFDGNGFTIYNLTQTAAGADGCAGLFGVTNGAEISDVALVGGSVTAADALHVGSLVANGTDSDISQSYSTLTINLGNASATVGGIAGVLSGTSHITECYNMGDIESNGASNTVGGICARAQSGTQIRYCYNVGNIRANGATAGGICASNSGSISQCYNASVILDANASYPVANGTVTQSAYDKQLYITNATGGEARATAQMTDTELSNIFSNGFWVYADDLYPALAVFAESEVESKVAASAASTLALNYRNPPGGDYTNFIYANMRSAVTIGTQTPVVAITSTNNSISPEILENGMYNLVPDEDGWTTITASVVHNGVTYKKTFVAYARLTLSVRYKFDFSALTKQTRPVDMGVVSYAVEIDTAAELAALAASINSGEEDTEGVVYRLSSDISLAGYNWTPIGTQEHKFRGTFNGACHVISNVEQRSENIGGIFGYVGVGARIENLGVENAVLTVEPDGRDTHLGGIAAYNEGVITTCYVIGSLTTDNASFRDEGVYTNMGGIVGTNAGRVAGCYFRMLGEIDNPSDSGLAHWTANVDYMRVGGVIGSNTGTLTGCYASTTYFGIQEGDLYGNTITGYNTGAVSYNFFDNLVNTTGIYGAYNRNDRLVSTVKRSIVASDEAALRLSANLYLGTYEYVEGMNDDYPVHGAFLMEPWMLTSFGDTPNMVLSVKNVDSDETHATAMNAICSYLGFYFPQYSKMIASANLNISVLDLPFNMVYNVDKVVVYGEGDATSVEYLDGNGLRGDPKAGWGLSTSTFPQGAQRIEIYISLSEDENPDIPWGVYRKWSSYVW